MHKLKDHPKTVSVWYSCGDSAAISYNLNSTDLINLRLQQHE